MEWNIEKCYDYNQTFKMNTVSVEGNSVDRPLNK